MPKRGYGSVAQKALIEQFAPAAVLVDREYHVLYYHGPIRDYIGPAPGDPSDDLLVLAAEGVRGKLRMALRLAATEGKRVEVGGAHVRRGEQWYTVRIIVSPVRQPESTNGMLLVAFEDEHKATPDTAAEIDQDSSQDSVVRQLEEELKNTRDELRSTIEQMETSNEELKASNEEVMSMNEELQSTNEELETSKEELQSLNEELTTLNSQLEDKVHELEETTNDLSNLLISTDIATVFLDREFRIRRYTPAIATLMRLIPSDIGRAVTDITWRFHDPDLLNEAAAVLARQSVEQREIQSEERSWFLRRVLPYRTEEGHIEGVVITFTDISRRKQAELALRQSESHMRRITDALPMLISYIDSELRYRFNNAAYQRWFEQDLESIQGKSLTDVLGAEAFEQIRPHAQAALAGKTVGFEEWVPYCRGGTRYISAQYIPDTNEKGQVQGFFAVITDHTERRRIEEQLARLNAENQRSLDEMRALLDAAPVGIFVGRDRACQEMLMNRAGAEMLRIPNDVNPSLSGPDSQALGFRVYHEGRELQPEELPMQLAAAKGKPVKGFEEELVFPDGSSINLLTYAAPLFDEKGEVRGCVGTFTDVTEQKRLESALQERTQRLELADRRKDEFLAMLGHELRNPLTPIRNAVQLLELQGEQDSEVKWAAQIIDRQTRHLERMVDDLLDMARIRKGRLRIEKQPLPLQRLVQESIAAMQPAIDEHHHRLTTALPEQSLIVSGDGTRLIQVLSNLLSNAVRYTPDGGQIRLTLTQTEQSQARIEVEDNGGGISPNLLPHVFEIFNQTQSLPERSCSGLGLGLSLVKQIVRLHQGEVMAESEGPGKGSRFIVYLPLTDGTEVMDRPEAESESRPLDTPKTLEILLVDDNPDVLDSLQKLLSALGHRVRVCDSGHKVLSAMQERLPDLVLLDLGMPDMDGYQVAKSLSKLAQRQAFKVVAVTGYAAEAQQIGEPSGLFDGHLLKPLTLDMLKSYL